MGTSLLFRLDHVIHIKFSSITYESNPRVPMPPPPADPQAFDIFLFFWSNSPPCGPFLWSNTPLARDFLAVKCPAPRAEVTKPRLISGNLNEVFNTAISIIFCIPEHCNRLFQDKKKSKTTNQYILNFVTQECFQKVRYHQA